MKKNFLINLDGYFLESLSEVYKEIIEENDNEIAFHCKEITTKKKLEDLFGKNIKIFCVEEFFLKEIKNFSYQDAERLEMEFDETIQNYNYGIFIYSIFNITSYLNKEKKNFLDIKRSVLYYKFYKKIFLEFNPDIVLHEHSGGSGSKILTSFCKKYNKKFYILFQFYFKNKFALIDYHNFKLKKNITQENISFLEFQNLVFQKKVAPLEIKFREKFTLSFIIRIKKFIKKIKQFNKLTLEENYILSNFPPIINSFFITYVSLIRKIIFNNFLCKKKIPKKKYISFFLQVEPEMTTYSFNHHTFDNFNLIKVISMSLPYDYYLVVKEHPSQFLGSKSRKISFYSKINSLSNVIISPLHYSSSEIINNSKVVITGSGTVAFESLLRQKKILAYGNNFYFDHPDIKKIYGYREVASVINDLIKHSEDYQDSQFNLKFCYDIFCSLYDGELELDKNTDKEINNKLLKKSIKKIILEA